MHTPPINAQGAQLIRAHLAHLPRPDHEAAQAIRDWATQQQLELDPDQVEVVTLHYRPDGEHGYQAVVTQRMSLTQAVLSNWQGESDNNLVGALFSAPWAGHFPNGPLRLVAYLPEPGPAHLGANHQVFNGLFRHSQPARYNAGNHVQLPAEAFQKFVWNLDFHSRFKSQLDDYWSHHLATHRLANKVSLIAACNRQSSDGSLGDAARRLVWQAAGLEQRPAHVQVRALNVYGYAATDLLHLHDSQAGLHVLYLPGNSAPLHTFNDAAALQDWVGEQCKSAEKRAALRRHFSLADLPDGLDFSGLDSALAGLADYPAVHRLPPQRPGFTTDGRWSPRDYVNYRPQTYSPLLEGDLFDALAARQRQRSYADADTLITSHAEINKARALSYLTTAINLVAPLAIVLPELVPLLALGGIAQFGLALDQAINGRTQQDKAQSVPAIAFGLFNALPLLAVGATESAQLWRIKSDNFVPPREVNGQWGYPLGPVSPPHLPELDIAAYFHLPDPITPLPDGDPALAAAVVRVPTYDGSPDVLEAVVEGYHEHMVYDMERDVFIREQDLNDIEPVGYIAQSGRMSLVRAGSREVDDAMRTRSLRALGIDLPLPVELPLQASDSLPIPKQISCLWVGDQVISDTLLSILASNATRLQGSAYRLRLFLSNATPAAYAQNLRLLAERAPGLQVLSLEEQAFFRAFAQGPYHAQYQAALDGNGGVASNFASAADVLRYPMLHHEGGLYMDVDDYLLAPGEAPLSVNGQPMGKPGEAIDSVELRTSADGLLLAPPMSNEKMGMNCLYNTSMIGSHPGNPTLEAISQEMHARYQGAADFYASKPSLSSDPQGFYRYANRLSRLTGPALFTDVVEPRLPALRTLRQVMNLYIIPRMNSWQFIDLPAYQQALADLLPLNRIAKVGGNHSWSRP